MSLLRKSSLILILCALSSHLLAAEEFIALEDGTQVKVLFFQPELSGEPAPLALLIAGGSGNEYMARTQFWLGKELRDRGWAIAVPISPDGTRFSAENAGLFPELIRQLHLSHELHAGKPLLVGISSGGTSAISIAVNNPEQYLGVVAAPGRIEDSELNSLDGLPIYLRIGELDSFRWNREIKDIVEALHNGGANVDAALVPDARHIFTLDWDDLDAWLGNLQNPTQ